MSQNPTPWAEMAASAPRVSGDEPNGKTTGKQPAKCSPRERG